MANSSSDKVPLLARQGAEGVSTNAVYESDTGPAPLRYQPRRTDDPLLHVHDHAGMGEDSEAYRAIQHLVTSTYRVRSFEDLALVKANSNRCFNAMACLATCCGARTFTVPNGAVRCASDGSGNFEMYGPGVHFIFNPFMTLKWENVKLTDRLIQHGNRTIVTVKQGEVGYAEDMGQPVLLPPGLHEWTSPTLQFIEAVDLNNTCIRLGPYTVLTVDEGYAAVTQNNGRQMILDGGQTHLLSHRNHKFEKFMSLKISTNDLERIEATSADNVKMHTTASCVWRVTDVMKAAKMSAETMRHDGRDVQRTDQSNMNKLQNDVLKQATASLAAFIGEIRYSDSFHLSAQVQDSPSSKGGAGGAKGPPVPEDLQDYSPIWDVKRMNKAVSNANEVTAEYGVTILSINIISAVPADQALQNALAKGAVASAEAEQAETVARGDARAVRIRAEGDAEANVIRANGSKKAADMLATTDLAVELARLEKLGAVFSDKTSFFFGASPHEVSQVLCNPRLVQTPQ
eukprot:m.173064 g.173064  ORF g.173064 m.173064 type:complete len:515 (-) comp13632_c0_seq1:202-1746(-)